LSTQAIEDDQPSEPVEPRRKKGCLFWLGRGLLVAGILLLGVALVSAGFEAAAVRADRRLYPPPGKLVDVGGYRLHIHCLGEGSPTVILESGAGEASPMWGWIQPQLAGITRVCAYDRAGFGWSDDGPQPREAQQIVNELHALLRNAGVQPPYILAGHSLGGELMRLYAGVHPDQVLGLVLIDSSHPEQMDRMPNIQEETAQGRLLTRAGALSAPFGLMRLYWGDGGPNPDLPPQESAAMRAFFATSRPYITMLAEDRARPQLDSQVAEIETPESLPLVVLSQDTTGEWMVLQEELAKLSSQSEWRVVQDASHMGLLTNPQFASQTSAAIEALVAKIRKGTP
jgi:pimeloyl-ACP methyl ester carboxylesterase